MFGTRRGGTGAGRGAGRPAGGRGLGGSAQCSCPKCGYSEPHTRGIPCSDKQCPKCGTRMVGARC
jgi:rubrerythrin